MKRMVIKVGSNVLTRGDGCFDTTRVSALVDQIVSLRRLGYEIILVSSGAVACGRSATVAADGLDEVQRRQLFASVGQVILMNHYYGLFADYGIKVGQVLTMKKNFETPEEYENQRSCMEGMLCSGLIPIVNENDTVSITELMFTDNDELSGLVAAMMGAQTLFILSNVDGIYDGDPADAASSVIRRVGPDDSVDGFVSEHKSEFGRGGMLSKCHIARQAARSGIRVVIANGKRDNILLDVLERPDTTVHTEFIAA
ncbi:MAG: glutamate 5-kinase [Bacteroidales bacterium]|nr:glutamate 5-kinase [Bacteroidales bacterium]